MRRILQILGVCFLAAVVPVSAKHDKGLDSKGASKTAEKKMKKIFKVIDADKSKKITEEELREYFKEMDGIGDVAANDGKVTKEEFVSANQFDKESKKKENRFSSELVFGRFDKNNDGILNETDVIKFIEACDKDKDKVCSQKEYDKEVEKETEPIEEAIEELFVNNDMNYNGFWDRLDQHALWNQYDVNKDGYITQYEFERFWNIRYCDNFGPGEDWFKIFDTNKDGVIDELHDKEYVIMAFDGNGDGKVTEDEMKEEMKKMAPMIPTKYKCKDVC